MLTLEQQKEFARFGILRLPGAIPSRDAAAMCNSVWEALRRHYDVRRDAPNTWNAQRITGMHDLPKSETFAQVASPAVREALDELLGRGNWEPPERWGSMLVAFPESRERWDVPHQSWHLDYPPSRSLSGLFLVRLFTCLASLPRGGGGTVFVQGSHRLVEDLPEKNGVEKMRSADVRNALIRNCAWVKELCSRDSKEGRVQRFMEHGGVFDDAELRVVEMTGEPGDILLTHPLLLHAPAKNCAAMPRIVLSSTVYRSGVSWREVYS
jgi:ectoine hydroxylase-related dioxygenase (phytanoyl-CoA dioxygenase family)